MGGTTTETLHRSVNRPQYIFGKVEKILKGSLDFILPPSPSVKIQITYVWELLGIVNKLLKTKVC